MLVAKEVVITTTALVVYGLLQERVMTRGWGAAQERFANTAADSAFLVLSNRLVTLAALALHSWRAGHSWVPAAPLRSYCLVSASNMVSTLCQYEALKHVSFVAQTLAKTAKALPVVLWGTLAGGKRYSARQYAHAALTTGGCSLFVLAGDITTGSAARLGGAAGSSGSAVVGGLLLLAYLAADGWTSTAQERLFRRYATPIREQLLFTTAFSAAYSLGVTLASRQLAPALAFLRRHPDAVLAVTALSLASTVIQVCISTVLQRHGALSFALMMTTRQCISVFLSTLLFGHRLGAGQWVGIVVAFSALYHQRTSGTPGSSSKQRSKQAASDAAAGPRMPRTRQSAGGVAPQATTAAAGAAGDAQAPGSLSSRGANGIVLRSHAGQSSQPDSGSRHQSQAGLFLAAADAAAAASRLRAQRGGGPATSGGSAAAAALDAHCVGVAEVQPHQPSAVPGPAAVTPPVIAHSKGPPTLVSLWTRGAGRVRVDPTTAVSLDHRER